MVVHDVESMSSCGCDWCGKVKNCTSVVLCHPFVYREPEMISLQVQAMSVLGTASPMMASIHRVFRSAYVHIRTCRVLELLSDIGQVTLSTMTRPGIPIQGRWLMKQVL